MHSLVEPLELLILETLLAHYDTLNHFGRRAQYTVGGIRFGAHRESFGDCPGTRLHDDYQPGLATFRHYLAGEFSGGLGADRADKAGAA